MMAQHREEDKVALIVPSAPADLKSPSKPRWQQRQEHRQRYLYDYRATRMVSPPTPSPMSLSPSPSPLAQDLAHDTVAGPRRQPDLTSTSLHYAEGAGTCKWTSTLTSTSTTPHFSRHTKSYSLPSDLFSQASTSNTSSSRTSESWLTCTDRETASVPPAIEYWPVKMSSQNDGGEQEPKKVNVFDVMLSAFDRKKKRNLPNGNNALQATQAPSSESLFLHRAACVYDPRKLEPRGAAERQDFSELRSFLDAHPARPEDRAQTYEPKSDFEWEDTDDDEDDSKVRVNPHKHSTKDRGSGGGGSRGFEGVLGGVLSSVGEGSDEGNLKARKSGAGTEFMSGGGPATYDFGVTSTVTKATDAQSTATSPDMMKAFNDPVWNHGYQLREEGEDDRVSQTPMPTMSSSTSFGSSGKGSLDNADSPSVARQIRKFEAHNTSQTSVGSQPRKYDPGADSATTTEHPSIPKFFARAKRAMSNREMSIATGNAFAQEEARKLSTRPEETIYTGQPSRRGENLTLCYSDNPTPSKIDRFKKVAEKLKISPSLSSPPQSLYGSSPASASSSFQKPSPRGLPAGPWEPDWDDAIKWARNELDKHAEREAKEARDLKREMKEEEKRLKKLNAGKDAIKRQSQLGMAPKKPLEDITEDEFELVGEAAMVADQSTPTTKTNLLGALFTKMQGSKEERKKRAHEIGHSLDNHASLHMLSKTRSSTADEPGAESTDQYNETLRMLEGKTPLPKELVSPFERGEADDMTPSVGLGISSPEQEELATRNRLAVKMSYEDFAEMKAKEQESRKMQPGHGRETPSPRPRLGQEAATIRPMTTIKELDRETTASPSSDKTIRASDNRNISPSIYSNDDVEESEYSSGQSTQVKQDIRNFRSGQYRYYEDDAVSIDTIESDAIPLPLSVQKSRVKHSTPKDSQGNQIGSRPKHVPILHVSKSSQHLQPTESKSFIPRRNSEFHSKIREQSIVQASKVGSHPALRINTDPTGTPSEAGKVRSHPALRVAADRTGFASKYSDDHDFDQRPETIATPARVDSGIGTSAGEVAGEGYGTGNMSQQEFARGKGSPATASVAESKKQPRQRKATLMAPDNTDALQATGIDLSALRREVGLDAAQLPGPQSVKHPNHPFTWHHEKVMCYAVHNPLNAQPSLPAIPENQPVDMGRLNSKHFSNSPSKGKIVGVKVCACCGTHCCRFAHLFNNSKKATNKDVAEENMRMKAEQRVDKLRAYHPNGIEEYDTFLTCLQCKRKVCPGCSTKCFEPLCGAIICTDCTPESGVCPVHDGE